MSELGQLLIVDDDRPFAAELMANAQKLDLTVKLVHDAPAFEQTLRAWRPTMIAMDLVMRNSDGLELIRICSRESYAAKLPEPFRPKQFSYLLMSLI